MMDVETTSAFMRTPVNGWEPLHRRVLIVGMAAEIVALFDELIERLRLVLSDAAYESLAPMVQALRDRSQDIVDDMKGQVKW